MCVHRPEQNEPCSTPVPCCANLLISTRSRHPGGVQACLADGSARFFNESIDLEIWRAYGTKAGGEIISEN